MFVGKPNTYAPLSHTHTHTYARAHIFIHQKIGSNETLKYKKNSVTTNVPK